MQHCLCAAYSNLTQIRTGPFIQEFSFFKFCLNPFPVIPGCQSSGLLWNSFVWGLLLFRKRFHFFFFENCYTKELLVSDNATIGRVQRALVKSLTSWFAGKSAVTRNLMPVAMLWVVQRKSAPRLSYLQRGLLGEEWGLG